MNYNYTDDKDREFEIEYSIYGQYSNGDLYSPPERPEVEISSITYKGKNFWNIEKRLLRKESQWLVDFLVKIDAVIWQDLKDQY